ncbi:MAG TPA: hypothetical protein DCS82_09680 [Rhodospirillaceae bacterium]|nr:hypothetical protein [Rhodospirillaceae bacterium]HAA93385.1 hypothetical protein [Rhodospirillaceae bacterium]HAT35975.1 hypothetical protein [Rhodospirillaceae bacterium]
MAQRDDIEHGLNQAMAAHQAGRTEEAEASYRAVLDMAPNNGDAANLLGLLKHEQGDQEEAIALIARARDASPTSPEFAANHAAILANSERFEESAEAYRDAIALAPDLDDLYPDLAQVLEQTGDFDGAADALEIAYRRTPDNDQMALDLARLLSETDRAADAVPVLAGLIEKHPHMLKLQLRHAQLLQDLYRMEEAEASCERAIAIDASHPLPHFQLARCRAQQGRWEDAIPVYEKAIELKPDYADAHLHLARAVQEAGDLDRAIELCEEAYRLRPGYRGVDILLGILLQEAGRFEEAAAEFECAVEHLPDGVSVAALAQCQLAGGDADTAKITAEGYLADHPDDTHVLVILSLILEALGDRDGVRRLVDFDHFLRPIQISAPEEFVDIGAFNDALAEHVIDHPSLTLSPPRNATRDGYHSGELFAEPMGPFAAFQTILRQAITDYIEALPDDPAHPFIAGKPEEWWLNAWAVVLDGPGHQISHAHNTAWLSGVYYVRLPDVVGDDSSDRAGWIEFGTPPPEFPVDLDPETVFIQPEEGKMVLFPGYMFHRTVPTGVTERRISVAFNIIPIPDQPD